MVIRSKPGNTCSTVQHAAECDDCGQDGVCARAPGCPRHWAERNAEIVRERDEARRKLAPLYDERDASRARAEQAERQRDEARAEAERLRLGRVELQRMHAAAVAEVERLRAMGDALCFALKVPEGPAMSARRAQAIWDWEHKP